MVEFRSGIGGGTGTLVRSGGAVVPGAALLQLRAPSLCLPRPGPVRPLPGTVADAVSQAPSAATQERGDVSGRQPYRQQDIRFPGVAAPSITGEALARRRCSRYSACTPAAATAGTAFCSGPGNADTNPGLVCLRVWLASPVPAVVEAHRRRICQRAWFAYVCSGPSMIAASAPDTTSVASTTGIFTRRM